MCLDLVKNKETGSSCSQDPGQTGNLNQSKMKQEEIPFEQRAEQIYNNYIERPELKNLKKGSEYPNELQRHRREAIERMEHELEHLKKLIINDMQQTFLTRLDRYVKIKLLTYTINKLKL